MSAPTIRTTFPSAEDVAQARESSRALSVVFRSSVHTHQIDFHDDNGAVHTVRIPMVALRLLMDILVEIGRGNAVSIIPINSELTTQDAAEVLNVSRPFLVQLLEKGELPFHKVGTHRRIRYQDVIEYKNRLDQERCEVLSDLAVEGQELNLGWDSTSG